MDTPDAVTPITDSNGHYQLDNFVVMHLSSMLINAQSKFGASASAYYLVPYDKQYTINFTLPYYEAAVDISGRVTDSNNNPIANASIHIRGFSGAEVTYDILADSNGFYSLNSVELEKPSNLYISASKSGYVSATTKITVSSNSIIVPDIVLHLQ